MLLLGTAAISQPESIITVGLEDFNGSTEVRCQTVSGGFEWMTVVNGQMQSTGTLDGIHSMAKTNRGYTLTTGTGSIESAYFILKPDDNHSRVRLISASTGYRQYTGAVHFYWHASRWYIALETELEDYVTGVLVSEVGKGHALALYAAHAAVSRTYALNTYGRHRLAGYDVCDQVHCQAFDGVSTVNDTIREGCRAARHLVITDRLGRPISAAFHSNCGGTTRSSEAVWQKASPHLLPVQDVECTNGAHAQWERVINANDWKGWQKRRTDELVKCIESREKFGLPSDRFDVRDEDEIVILSGRGFGHGVGMCQEGAIARAQKGASAWAILSTYYQDVRLRSLQEITIPEGSGAWGK
jgi:peptidoglycan hydrolase-like amidase